VGGFGLQSPTSLLEGIDMSKSEMDSLAEIGEPNRVEIVPGLILEDKLRIKTQRKLERQFGLPIAKIFPGMDPKTKELWEGVDFNFLDNAIPLFTILAQQADEKITETDIENIFESGDQTMLAKNIEKFFKKLVSDAKPKNRRKPNPKKKK